MIYLDNNATTRTDPRVEERMSVCNALAWANPSSLHAAGRRARQTVDQARAELASLIGAEPEEIVFTSGGTESLNTALHSAITSFPDWQRLVITATEHSATSGPCALWERRGLEVVRIPVDRDGLPDLDAFSKAVTERPSIASIIWANNETGVINPMPEIASRAHEAGALLITDAVQAVGKIPVDVSAIPVSMLALSAHKFHGPKGCGALYVNRRLRFHSLLHGGGQEAGRRSGTENVPGIAGLGCAASLPMTLPDPGLTARRDWFETEVIRRHPRAVIHGHRAPRLPNTTNIAFPGFDAEAILILLDQAGICASPGSACGSAARNPSPVLTAMGLSAEEVKASVRFSLGRETTEGELATVLDELDRTLVRLASLQPAGGGPVIRRSVP
ncbi:MAG: cysteine desulfurase [Verrucomicrobia bacterium]|nr:cysteine desulfurase [Verrucomicrobiota bacterium]